MLQIKRVLLAFSVSIFGPLVIIFLLFPQSNMMQGKQLPITSGTLVMESCLPDFKPSPKRHVTLPFREEVYRDGLKCYRFEADLPDINLIPSDHPVKLMMVVLGRAHEISLNGHVLDRYIASNESMKIVRYQPYSVLLHDSLLKNSTNRLTIRYATQDMVIAVSQMAIGSQEAIDASVLFYEFFSKTMINAMSILLMMLGMGLFWFNSLFPKERLMGLAGRTMLIMAVAMIVQLKAEIPVFLYPFWRGIGIGLIGWLVVTAVEFLREYSGQNLSDASKRLISVYVSVLALLAFATNDQITSYCTMFGIGLLIIYLYTSLMWAVLRSNLLQSKIGILYFGSFILTNLMFFRDFMLLPGNASLLERVKTILPLPPFLQEEIFFSSSTLILIMFATMVVVVQRYQIAKDYQEAEAVRIYGALSQNEAELRVVLGQQHAVESAQVVQAERQRLLLEIHDGIGLQLAEGYRQASEDKLSSEQFADVFQSCIDDMRLIMDCISMRPRAEMDVILGALLHRLQPRLTKRGIEVDYRPLKRQQSRTGLSDVQCLHAGRIVQGALIAALRQASCNKIQLVMREDARGIFIAVHANGQDFTGQDNHERQAHEEEMRKRAASLGSRIRFYHGEHGHATVLLYRFARQA